MSKIITISGSAQHGKDTCATYMREYLMSKNKNVMIIHFADVLKFVAKQWYGWDGVKDEHGRTLLQYLGTDVFRKNRPDCWATIVKELILGMGNTVDFVIEPDCRFPNEIITMREMRETWVRSLGWENPLEKSMATHTRILACRTPTDRGTWRTPTEEPGGLQSMWWQTVGHD